MRCFLASIIAGPMVLAAIMGADLWFKLSFVAAAVCIVILLFVPERELVADDPDEMPPFMTTDQVLAFVERKKRSA